MNIDQAVNAWALKGFREDCKGKGLPTPEFHLRDCPETVAQVKASDGFYGCDTGCNYWRMTSVVSCPHGFLRVDEDSDFGKLGDVIDGIAEFVEGDPYDACLEFDTEPS